MPILLKDMFDGPNGGRMRLAVNVQHVPVVLLLSLQATVAHAAPQAIITPTAQREVLCLRDADQDRTITLTNSAEVTLTNSPEECAEGGGAIAERESREEVADFNATLNSVPVRSLEELKLYLFISDAYTSSSHRESSPSSSSSTNSSTGQSSSDGGSLSSSPSSSSPLDMAINGPINGVRAGGLLSKGIRGEILSKIAPPLRGRRYRNTGEHETTFNCQDFTEWAENAYPDLTVAGVQCSLMCKKRLRVPGIGSPWEKVDGFGHLFLDYHQGKAIYFLEPQSALTKNLLQLNLDLNRDGIISPVEEGTFKDLLPFGRFFHTKCSGESKILCRNHSFEDRQHAYDYWRARGHTVVRPPKLPRRSPLTP